MFDFSEVERFLTIEISRHESAAFIDSDVLSDFAEKMGVESRAGYLPEKLGVFMRRAHTIEKTPTTGGNYGDFLREYYAWATQKLLEAIKKESFV